MSQTFTEIVSVEEIAAKWDKSFWQLNTIINDGKLTLYALHDLQPRIGNNDEVLYELNPVHCIPIDEENLPVGDEEPRYKTYGYYFDLSEIKKYEEKNPHVLFQKRKHEKSEDVNSENFPQQSAPKFDINNIGVPPPMPAQEDKPSDTLTSLSIPNSLWAGKKIGDAFNALNEKYEECVLAYTIFKKLTCGKDKTKLGRLFYGEDEQGLEEKNYRNRVDNLIEEATQKYKFDFYQD